MESISQANTLLLVLAAVALVGILSSLAARRFGAPLLLVFLGIGMLLGEDGLGIVFNNYEFAYLIGSFALAVILFDGGLHTRLNTFRRALAPAITLATLGVVLTATLTGIGAFYLLELTWLEALLLGAIVASTDAAAVFFLLRAGGLQLKRPMGPVLEIESGTNDPVAMLMTLILTQLVLAQGAGWQVGVLVDLALQAGLGALFGVAFGFAATFALNRLQLQAGLHPLLAMSTAVLTYALTARLGGSGFVAVYLAGLIIGNRPVRAYPAIVSFHEAITWLAQMTMFLILGLLVTPTTLMNYALPGLLIALGLMLVARPLAVWLCLMPFGFAARDKFFISWVGLRGAVSIFLASIPTLVGAPHAEGYFNVAFFVVLTSLIVQGWTLAPMAKLLKVGAVRAQREVRRLEIDLPGQVESELVSYPLSEKSAIFEDAALPRWVRLVFVVRENSVMEPSEAGELQPGDYAYFLAPVSHVGQLDRFLGARGVRLGPRAFPERSEYSLKGAASLTRICRRNALPLPESPELPESATINDFFKAKLDGQPTSGDVVRLGAATFTADRVKGGDVQSATLRFDDEKLNFGRRLMKRVSTPLPGGLGRSPGPAG